MLTIRFAAQPKPQPQRIPPSGGGRGTGLLEDRPQPPTPPGGGKSSGPGLLPRFFAALAIIFGLASVDRTLPNEQAMVRYPFVQEPVIVQPKTYFFHPPMLSEVQRNKLSDQ